MWAVNRNCCIKIDSILSHVPELQTAPETIITCPDLKEDVLQRIHLEEVGINSRLKSTESFQLANRIFWYRREKIYWSRNCIEFAESNHLQPTQLRIKMKKPLIGMAIRCDDLGCFENNYDVGIYIAVLPEDELCLIWVGLVHSSHCIAGRSVESVTVHWLQAKINIFDGAYSLTIFKTTRKMCSQAGDKLGS